VVSGNPPISEISVSSNDSFTAHLNLAHGNLKLKVTKTNQLLKQKYIYSRREESESGRSGTALSDWIPVLLHQEILSADIHVRVRPVHSLVGRPESPAA
jgi:hypothetical protein